MILGLLISILSVSYIVTSSNSVEVNGSAPIGTIATYERSGTTGKKGQMTSGNSTTLELTGWEGYVIDSVVLSMCSNSTQGAGSLCMQIGEKNVWEIPDTDFASVKWHGSFSSAWVDIRQKIAQQVGFEEQISIHIKASKNSLYIDSYTIYYTIPEKEAYEVQFVSGLSEKPAPIKEEAIGSGILLPEWRDTLHYQFVGWCEKEVIDQTSCPRLLTAGELYFPQRHCTLWAVYADGEIVENSTSNQSGEYAIAMENKYWQNALSGSITNGMIATRKISIEPTSDGKIRLLTGIEKDMAYQIDFKEDSTLTIRHISTGKNIGYSGSKLAEKASIWHYRTLPDDTYCIYYIDNNTYRILRMGNGSDGKHPEIVAYTTRADISLMLENGLLLFEAQEVKFTSWPFGKFDNVENIWKPQVEQDYTIRWGQYLLHIKNGKKMLQITN